MIAAEMKAFCDQHAPGLFGHLYKSIVNDEKEKPSKKCNFQNRKFMLFIEDDICFIHAKQHPQSSVTSTTWHMCTAVVDVHDKMEAVDLGDNITKNHSNVQVTMENGSV